MSRLVSMATKIEQLSGMLGTEDLTEWEQGFVRNVSETFDRTKSSAALSERQIGIVERIYDKHSA